MFTVQGRESSRRVVRWIAIAFTISCMAVAGVYINCLTYATFDAPLQLSDTKPAMTLGDNPGNQAATVDVHATNELGWQTGLDGKREVIVQMTPQEAAAIEHDRLERVVHVPANLRDGVDRIIVRVGLEELPQGDGNAGHDSSPRHHSLSVIPQSQLGLPVVSALPSISSSVSAGDRVPAMDAEQLSMDLRVQSSHHRDEQQVAELKSLVAAEFDKNHARQQKMVELMEAELERAKAVLSQRAVHREQLVCDRVTHLLGEQAPLDWDYEPKVRVSEFEVDAALKRDRQEQEMAEEVDDAPPSPRR